MPIYSYTAKSFDGKTEIGTMSAKDEREISQDLKQKGMVLVAAVLQSEKLKLNFNISFSFLGVGAVEKIMMVRNMGVMFSTGLALVKTFEILSLQAKNKTLKSALENIKSEISKGESLSDSLAKYPKIFSELFVSMVKVGEESGTLDEIFQVLALQISKEYELKSKIRSAMIYPALIMAVMLVIGAIIIKFVLPSLNIFFTTLSIQIPLHTRILLAVGNFLGTHWYLLFLIPLALALCFWLFLKTKNGKRVFDRLLLKLPIIAPIVKKSSSAFFIRSLSSLIAAGVPLTRCLEITASTLRHYEFRQALAEATEKIKKGEKLSGALRSHQTIFPFGVLEMMEVGEETGKTSDILKKLADFYEQEAMRGIEKLTILLEPLLIIILGLGVGVFAISIIQPVYSSLQLINQ